jgi:hypothetical protein
LVPIGQEKRKKEQIIMSISRLKALRCRRMLLALLAARPGNHLHPPDLARHWQADTKDRKS